MESWLEGTLEAEIATARKSIRKPVDGLDEEETIVLKWLKSREQPTDRPSAGPSPRLALRLVDQHIGHLHPDHRALAKMRRNAIGMVLEGEGASLAGELSRRDRPARPSSLRDRIRLDGRQRFLRLRRFGSRKQRVGFGRCFGLPVLSGYSVRRNT